MNYERRDQICRRFFDECQAMGGTKGKEYTRDEDALSNFTGVAEDLGILNPFQVMYVYAKKHWDAIRSFARRGKVFSEEGIRGRLVDMAVYCALMACWLEEKKMLEEENYQAEGIRVDDESRAWAERKWKAELQERIGESHVPKLKEMSPDEKT